MPKPNVFSSGGRWPRQNNEIDRLKEEYNFQSLYLYKLNAIRYFLKLQICSPPKSKSNCELLIGNYPALKICSLFIFENTILLKIRTIDLKKTKNIYFQDKNKTKI